MAVASTLITLVLAGVIVFRLRSSALGLLLVVVSLSGGALLWFGLQPPTLQAGADELSVLAPGSRQQMPRSDLALVFRGQIFGRGRTSAWVPSYVFVARDGRVGLSVPSSRFTEEGMAAFAQRLGVSMRGDFSQQVGDRVDPG